MRRVRGPAALLSALAIAVSAAPADAHVIAAFTTPATGQSWTVPDDVTSVVVSLYGAQGGDDADHTHAPGGLGGHTMFALTVTPGTTYQVNVGGHGGDGFRGAGPGGAGGVNGGAPGGNIAVVGRSAGGGGATDIRDGLFSLNDRIGVAGGGGGATTVVDTSVGDGGGGGGGGSTGGDGSNNLRAGDQGNPEGGNGGTPAAGGAGGLTNATYPHVGGDGLAGTFGAGGLGGDLVGGTNGDAGGGGGGGWYGGGGGGGGGTDPDGPNTFQGGGAGGGGSGHGPNGAIFDSGAQTGDGAAFISAPVPPPTDLALVGSTPSSQPPTITGAAETDSAVSLYLSPSCDGPAVGSGSAAAFGTQGIAAALGSDGDHTIYARAVDGGGVPSPCSATGVAFELDTTPPSTPLLTGTTPSSPANSATPVLDGSADTDSTVDVYATANCTGPVVATAAGDVLASPGIALAVAAGSTSHFTVTAHDAALNTSGCSNSVTYVEDETAPDAPTDLVISPPSPARDNSPKVSGTAEAGSTVEVFAHDGCTPSPAVTPTAAAFALGVTVSVADDSTTTFSVDAVDAAGNRSACATAGTYVEDETPPPAPASLASSPASPSRVLAPRIKGSAQAGSTVVVYADPACQDGTDVASGTAAAFGSPGLAVTVGPNSMTSFTARATDAAGNVSTCSDAFAYVEDELAPAAPAGFVLTPSSPANANDATLEGTAEAGSRVELWATPDCSGRMITSGTQAAFASPGLDFSVADDTTTTMYADAIDAAGNTSLCSEGVTYVEDSSSPVPSSLAVSPASPANENAPTVSGSAEHLATVRLYPTAGCTGQPLASGSAATFASPGIAISVADDTTTVVYLQATDAVGNVSPCSAGVTYVEDSTPPGAPSGLTVVPASPANDNAPVVRGSSEPGSTVRLFASSDCSGSPIATATAAMFASPGMTVTVADDSSTALRTRVTDAAGNASGCSAAVTYREDSTAPPVTLSGPAGGSTTDTAPVLSGIAGTGTGDSATVTVTVYAGAVAAGTPVATLTATRDGGSGAFSVASTPLAVGTYTARAIQADSAGNTGVSAAVTFSVAGPSIEPPPPATTTTTTPITPPSPTTPTTPVHPAGAPQAPALRLSQPSTHLDHGQVRLTLSCRGTSAQTCTGTIRLRSESSRSKRGNPAFTGTSIRYTVTGGRSKELRFTLPAAVATAIRARGHLTIVVAYGPTGASRKTITVRP